MGADIGDTVFITENGSWWGRCGFDSIAPHVITKIDSVGYVEFDGGMATCFRPVVQILEKAVGKMMKSLTLYQPWASLVAMGEKKFETRGWPTNYRGPILIHAGKKPFKTDSYLDRELYPFADALGLPDIYSFDSMPCGSIIAVAELVNCLKIVSRVKVSGNQFFARLENEQDITRNELYFGDYEVGRFAWELANVHRLAEPIRAKGMQRIWNFDETPHQVAIDPWIIGPTKIWTPEGIRSGKRVDSGKEDAVLGLEVA